MVVKDIYVSTHMTAASEVTEYIAMYNFLFSQGLGSQVGTFIRPQSLLHGC